MHDLLTLACRTLEDPTSSPAMKSAASEALLTAAREGLTMPARGARAIWAWWTTAPGHRSCRNTSKLGDVPDEEIRAGALAVLDRADAGDELRSLAVDVLCGKGHARHLDDGVLLRAFENVRTGDAAQELLRLAQAVHAGRGITPCILRNIRDRWAGSAVPAIRETAIYVAVEIAEPDLGFIAKMLADPDVEVRVALAHQLDCDFPGRERALPLVENRLREEVHPQARVTLLRTQASLIEVTVSRPARRKSES